jgi:hypothetical protein
LYSYFNRFLLKKPTAGQNPSGFFLLFYISFRLYNQVLLLVTWVVVLVVIALAFIAFVLVGPLAYLVLAVLAVVVVIAVLPVALPFLSLPYIS